jgi:hypothetical protein
MRRIKPRHLTQANFAAPSRRKVAAYHEAAHAVARLVHGLSFDTAVVDDEGGGGVEIAGTPKGLPWGAAVRALAGPIAESRYTGQAFDAVVAVGGGMTDYKYAKEYLKFTEREMPEARQAAHRLVCKYWPAIMQVAAVLDAKGEITPLDVIAALRASGLMGCLPPEAESGATPEGKDRCDNDTAANSPPIAHSVERSCPGADGNPL